VFSFKRNKIFFFSLKAASLTIKFPILMTLQKKNKKKNNFLFTVYALNYLFFLYASN
jgi:hypothetical protein